MLVIMKRTLTVTVDVFFHLCPLSNLKTNLNRSYSIFFVENIRNVWCSQKRCFVNSPIMIRAGRAVESFNNILNH